MRAFRDSLVLLTLASPARAVPSPCDALLEVRFDRPTAARTAPSDTIEPLAVDLDDLVLDLSVAAAARIALGDLDRSLVKRVLEGAGPDEQARAFRTLFACADLANVAQAPRVTVATLVGQTFISAAREILDRAAERTARTMCPDELRERARARLSESSRVLRRELDEAGTHRRLKFSPGPSEFIATDASTGLPDRYSYELARRVELAAPNVALFPPGSRALARRLVRAKRRALARAWDTPHYRPLVDRVRYTEPVANGYVDRPIKDFIESARHRHSYWWESFDKFAEFEDLAAGRAPGARARITAETSGSPLAYLFGRRAERKVFWPAIRDRDGIRPDLRRLALNETLIDGRVEAVELLANAGIGTAPEAYLFTDLAGELVPTLKFNRQPIGAACVRCHQTHVGSGVPAFQPFFMKTAADMRRVGFRGERIITDLLRRN